jgi:hypothetical protein
MELNLVKYSMEIVEFICAETLKQIDYGVLDLSKIRDNELREVLLYFEELLTLELKMNYSNNGTGIFRVSVIAGRYVYEEFGCVIEADSIFELKELVLSEDRIWYVFDEISAEKTIMEVV